MAGVSTIDCSSQHLVLRVILFNNNCNNIISKIFRFYVLYTGAYCLPHRNPTLALYAMSVLSNLHDTRSTSSQQIQNSASLTCDYVKIKWLFNERNNFITIYKRLKWFWGEIFVSIVVQYLFSYSYILKDQNLN